MGGAAPSLVPRGAALTPSRRGQSPASASAEPDRDRELHFTPGAEHLPAQVQRKVNGRRSQEETRAPTLAREYDVMDQAPPQPAGGSAPQFAPNGSLLPPPSLPPPSPLPW